MPGFHKVRSLQRLWDCLQQTSGQMAGLVSQAMHL